MGGSYTSASSGWAIGQSVLGIWVSSGRYLRRAPEAEIVRIGSLNLSKVIPCIAISAGSAVGNLSQKTLPSNFKPRIFSHMKFAGTWLIGLSLPPPPARYVVQL
jgi:hypothetical protein